MLTPAELAAALNVSTRTVARWDADGCPCEWAGSRRRYDLAAVKAERGDQAEALLQRCLDGFGAYIHGRKLAKPQRDRLRQDLQDFLEGSHVRAIQPKCDVSTSNNSDWS